MLSHLTLVLALAERASIKADVRFSNALYARNGQSDWFPDFFELTTATRRADNKRPLRVRIRNDIDHEVLGSAVALTLDEGRAVFNRNVRIKPFLNDAARAFFEDTFAGRSVLAVHYRGTDKHSEAPHVERARAIGIIGRQIRRGGHTAIFLATDEPAFGKELRAALPGLLIASYSCPQLAPAKPGEPIHFSSGDGYWKGVDALVNILLLARCGAIVRTASYLSGWAKVLNPAQQVLMLNQAFSTTRFPDNCIVSDIADD